MTEWLLNIMVILAIIMLLLSITIKASALYLTWKHRKEKKIVMTGVRPEKLTAEALKSTNFRG